MEITVVKKLEVENEKGEYLELGCGDDVTIWTKDGSCMAANIVEIKEDSIIVLDEDDEERPITFDEITDIED